MEDLKDNDALPATHIMRHHESQKEGWLFRTSDGINVGTYQELIVVFGENPNRREGRMFMDNEYAKNWLETKVANDDARAQGLEGAVVIHENIEATLIMPASMLAQPGPQSMTKVGKKIN